MIYLDSAATTLKPKCVIDAISHFYSEEYGTVHRAIYERARLSTDRYQNVRLKVADFIGAASMDEIIFTKGTTEAINLVASSFCRAFLHEGDEVIISVMEHHSNLVPWQEACKRAGATLKYIPIDDRGVLDMQVYKSLLSERTKLVSIAHVANSTGTINPIKEIASLAHAKGAKVFVDGAQSAPHMSIDVQALGADFYAFSGHKMYGPTGIGILYGKRELLTQMPPYHFGSDMIDHVTLEGATYQEDPPLRFEAGTPPIAQVVGLGAALSFIESHGVEKIAAHEDALLRQATDMISTIEGIQIIGTAPNKGPIITFTIDGVHPLDLGTLLDARGISVRTGHLCAQPTLQHFGLSSALRLSFGIYNTSQEVEQCVSAIKSLLPILA